MKQAKNVMIILYNNDFISLIESLRPYKWAYICHNMDTDENGEIKKEHWHLLLSFETKKSLSLIAKMLNVEENLIECVNNYKSMERYLIHLDNPEKYQYSCDSVVSNYDYEIQVYSTTESILKFLIEECEKYDNIRDFNIMVMRLGLDYMKVYKSYYSMIKDVIYYNNVVRNARLTSYKMTNNIVKEMCNDEILKEYHNIIINDKRGYDAGYAEKVINAAVKRGLVACEGLILDKGENE